jgi:hypothetical protein
MNELNTDELVYYKKDDNFYSGGFKIHSILNNSLHDSLQTGGSSFSSLAIPLGLYSNDSVNKPFLKKIYTSSETFVENNSHSNKRKTRKKY